MSRKKFIVATLSQPRGFSPRIVGESNGLVNPNDPRAKAARLGKIALLGVIGLFMLAARSNAQDAPPGPHHPLPSLMQWEAAGAPRDPIMSIDHHMGYIVDDLSDRKTDLPVQAKQKQVVGELDTIIKQLEEQMKSGGNGGSRNPTKPASKSTLAKGPGGSGPLHDPRAGGKQWGDLSPKERDQIMQSQTEGFPPGYEAVLASYYNRLAQEKVAADGNVPGSNVQGPTTRP